MTPYAAVIVGGLVDAAVLAVAAVGFSLQFSVTNYVNFAYGQLITFGAFMAFIVDVHLKFGIWVSFLFAGVTVALLAYVMGQWIYAPFFRRRPQVLYILVVSFAVALVLASIYLIIWQSNTYELQYFGNTAVYKTGPFVWAADELVDIGGAALILVLLYLGLRFTRLGRSMRAVADNQSLAAVAGLNSKRIVGYTWLISGFLAGLAGVVEADLLHAFDVTLGNTFLFLMITAVLVAGIGRPYAAVVGALIIAFAGQIAVYVIGAAYAPVGAFATLVVILLVRPQGVLGGGRTTLHNA